MTDAASRSYIQRDGKMLTIDAKGHVKRLLPSGARDPEPLGGRSRPHPQHPGDGLLGAGCLSARATCLHGGGQRFERKPT